MTMNVLHVTDTDLPARRFNGYNLLDDLKPRGIHGKQIVLRKQSDKKDVIGLFDGPGDALLQVRLQQAEYRHSINGLLVPWGRLLFENSAFKNADIVHYHLIHNHVLSLFDLPWLFGAKPAVWTFHDPWPLTGHCIHPMESDGWLTGCAPCPFLERLFPLRDDRADQLWRVKKRIFSQLDVDVVVASAWMRDMVERSPITSHLDRVHLIPFGLDSRLVLSALDRMTSRRALGIAESDFVILVRASSWDVKGLPYIIEALGARPPSRPTTVLVVDGRGMLAALTDQYRIIEMGWVGEEPLYATILAASDVLLMPSLAEAFGLMAVEAMAAGRAVICFEGTALPAITHAPNCGLAVPNGDSMALRSAVDLLCSDPSESERRGELGRRIAAEQYDHERYLDSLVGLYRSVLARHSAIRDTGPQK